MSGQNRLLLRRLPTSLHRQQTSIRFQCSHTRIRWRSPIGFATSGHPPILPPTRFLSSASSISDHEYSAAVGSAIDHDDSGGGNISTSDSIDDSVAVAADAAPADERNADPFNPLVRAIHDNVEAILTQQERLLDESANNPPGRRSVREKWHNVFDREMQMMGRRMRNNHPRQERVPVDELWDQALLSLHEEESQADDASGVDEQVVPEATYSPIFGIAMDDQVLADDNLDLWMDDYLEEELIDAEGALDHSDEKEDITVEFPELEKLFGKNRNSATRQERQYDEAILRSISLLSVLNSDDWKQLQTGNLQTEETDDDTENSSSEIDSDEDDSQDGDSDLTEFGTAERTSADRRFDETSEGEEQHALTTLQANLMLAHLVASVDADSTTIVDECLQIYNEMKLLGDSGHVQCQPDAITYRILILAFNQRFMAPSEAINLSQIMMKSESTIVTPSAFLEAMRACHAKMDLDAARSMMDAVFTDTTMKPSSGSYALFVDMLKANDLRTEALEFFRKLCDASLLAPEAQDRILMNICRWPRTTRQGNFVDLSSFLLDILSMINEMVAQDEKPGMSVWMSLINNMNIAARNDPSLWEDIASAMRTVLDLYPESYLGQKLAITGLNASVFWGDPKLAANIFERVSTEKSPMSRQIQDNDRSEGADAPLIPFAVIKAAMDMCLQQSDAVSAETMVDAVVDFGNQYPDGALRELSSLLLLCHAKTGNPDKALLGLKSMINDGMSPGEDLYGAVLHSMILAGRQNDAEALVQSMEAGKDGMNVTPGTSSYDALLVGRVRSHDWDGAISIYDVMKDKGIDIGPQTIQGLVLAHQQKGGEEAVVSAMETILENEKARIRGGVFRLIARMLFKEMNLESFDSFRQQIRTVGEEDPTLRESSLQLVRSLRVAETETERPSSKHKSDTEMQAIQDQAWIDATKDMLDFFRAVNEGRGATEDN